MSFEWAELAWVGPVRDELVNAEARVAEFRAEGFCDVDSGEETIPRRLGVLVSDDRSFRAVLIIRYVDHEYRQRLMTSSVDALHFSANA